MKKYIVMYHAPMDALEQMQNMSPEEGAKGMEAWMDWAKQCGNHMVDLGTPLGMGQKMRVDGSSAPSTREVCGYTILQAESMDKAKELLKGHPHLSGWDNACEIELHEAMPLPGQ